MPLQVRGKGLWGKWEGVEELFDLRHEAGAFVQNPLNYVRVHDLLAAMPTTDAVKVKDTIKWHNTGFSGACDIHVFVSTWPLCLPIVGTRDVMRQMQACPRERSREGCM